MGHTILEYIDSVMTVVNYCIHSSWEAEDHKHSSFVVSKTHAAPLKTHTIPAISPSSLTIADSLMMRLDLEQPRCFTDSQVAILWIIGSGWEWKPFVQHKVNEIHRLLQWNVGPYVNPSHAWLLDNFTEQSAMLLLRYLICLERGWTCGCLL